MNRRGLTAVAGLALAAALMSAGCGGEAQDASAEPAPVRDDKPSAMDDYLSSTTVPTTTTTAPTTTTTTPNATITADSAEGWRWEVNVAWDGTSPAAGPRGCVPVAPPGQTNARYTITVTNLIEDRPSPLPNLFLDTNIDAAGTVVPADDSMFEDYGWIERSRTGELETYEEGEMYFGGTSMLDCVLAFGLEPSSTQIPSGGSVTWIGAVGPVPDPPPAGLVLRGRTNVNTFILPYGPQ